MKPRLCGAAGEVGKPRGELAACLPLPPPDLSRKVPHGEQRRGWDIVGGHHVGRDYLDLLLLHLAVLEGAQDILEGFELTYRLPLGCRVMQGREELQGIAQLLAPFAEVVEVLGGGVV